MLYQAIFLAIAAQVVGVSAELDEVMQLQVALQLALFVLRNAAVLEEVFVIIVVLVSNEIFEVGVEQSLLKLGCVFKGICFENIARGKNVSQRLIIGVG